MNILEKITAGRRKTFAKDKAIAQDLPEIRTLPLVPFFTKQKPFIIAELKKTSPSKGKISHCSHEQLICDYYRGGVRRFSVLTERQYFKGSLKDLYTLKTKYPRCAFLRKDFLFCEEDVFHAYRAGADAILLITEILNDNTLLGLILRAHYLGLQVLCEVHSLASLQRVLALRELPDAIGINSRDLKTFNVLREQPLRIKPYIPRSIPVVYESGVDNEYLLSLIGNAGFQAALIGEAVVKNKNRKQMLKKFTKALQKGAKQKANYFTKLYARQKKILVKICGLTNKYDTEQAVQSGADVLGFVLAPKSPRCVNEKLLREVKNIKALKVAVVQDPNDIHSLKRLLKRGLIDAVQFHGKESAELVYSFQGNAYKATTNTKQQFLPVTMYDAPKTKTMRKGKKIAVKNYGFIQGQWLAGGLSPQNIRKLVKQLKPGLVDVSSGVEIKPGAKDRQKMVKFCQEVARA